MLKQCEGRECPCKSQNFSLSIWTAAQYGDIHRIHQIGDSNPSSLRKVDKYGYTALHYASQSGHIGIVRYLLQIKVHVDTDECGATPLHRAAYAGRLEVCDLLIKHGANVYAVDFSIRDCAIPVEKAFQQGHHEIVTLILTYMTDEYKSIYAHRERPMKDPEASSPLIEPSSVKVSQSIDRPEHTDVIMAPSKYCHETSLPRPCCSVCGMPSLSFSAVNMKLVCLKCRYKRR